MLNHIIKQILPKLVSIVGRDHVKTAEEDIVCYSYDASGDAINDAANRPSCPDVIVLPASTEQVAAVMKLANEFRCPVVPRGAGTGMTGGSLAIKGGIVMVMTRLNKILSVDMDNLTAEVEPGVVTGEFQRLVEGKGLFYPPDPSSADYSTLGGNAAECAGGSRAVKYGVTRDYILGLEVVLPTGEVIRTGVRTAKGVVGYDLTRLVVGSEGTLGIITKLIVRLLAKPQAIGTMSAYFSNLLDAARTVSEITRLGAMPRAVEYMDRAALQCVQGYLGIDLAADAGAMLLIDVDGTELGVESQLKSVVALCEQGGAWDISVATTPQKAQTLWRARHAMSPALFRLGPDKINEDIVVPRSKIPDIVEWIDGVAKETGLSIVTFGHAGDGNIHFNIMLDKTDESVYQRALAVVEQLFIKTVALGGTLSGEHGIGITKAPYLNIELGVDEIALMKRIKAAFDPNGVLNPGKIFAGADAPNGSDWLRTSGLN